MCLSLKGVPGELWEIEPGSSACKAYSLTFESPFSPVLFCAFLSPLVLDILVPIDSVEGSS